MSNITEYPKQLYRKGWDDLSDTIVVESQEEEDAVRAEGFKMLPEFDSPVSDVISVDSAAKPLIDAIKSGALSNEELVSLAESEKAGKNRKGVLAAIAEKLEG